jgi:hypothetical protein
MCVSFIGNTTEMIAAFLGIVSYTPPKKSFFDKGIVLCEVVRAPNH